MAISFTELLFSTPLGIYEIYSNAIAGPLEPWKGWADTHFDFSRVVTFPAFIWRRDPTLAIPLELSRWVLPLCALAFFAFFGFAEEARKHYRAAAMAVATRVPCVRQIQEKRATKSSKFVPSSLCCCSSCANSISRRLKPFRMSAIPVLPYPVVVPPPYSPRADSFASSPSRASTTTLEMELKNVITFVRS